uniref:No apical meristem-associated C-terminal domain-containing protein n=1 Tax=Brassica oleracea var. oleracea TaxID=109376 RepID=A0A0D3E1J6_BRAOL
MEHVSEKAIILLSPWIVGIPAILPVSTPPNGILCLYGSCDNAILALSPWINWNRKTSSWFDREFYLFVGSILSCGGSPRRLTELSVWRWLSSTADGALSRWLSANRSAHEIYFNNQTKKFSLEHAWNELRNDQKWCELATSKTESSSKRRKFADGSHSGASSQVNECDAGVEGTSRPSGVKAAKARGKKPQVEGQDVSDYQLMWSIKKDDLAMKQQLSKMRVLEKLLAKENLADYEEDLKKKLINELM